MSVDKENCIELSHALHVSLSKLFVLYLKDFTCEMPRRTVAIEWKVMINNQSGDLSDTVDGS